MTINAVSKTRRFFVFLDGSRIDSAFMEDYDEGGGSPAEYPYLVYPILTDGIFNNDTIPNTSAKWKVVSADSAERWEWFDGGGYTFDASGASTGTYSAVYEVQNWDGNGNNAQATITVTVTA